MTRDIEDLIAAEDEGETLTPDEKQVLDEFFDRVDE